MVTSLWFVSYSSGDFCPSMDMLSCVVHPCVDLRHVVLRIYRDCDLF